MAPLIEVNEETLEKDFIYVESMKLYVAKERTYCDRNWHHPHKVLKNEKPRMPELPEFISFLNYLKEHPSEENKKILRDITQERSPFRGEFIDAYFKKGDDGLYVLTKNKPKGEKLGEYPITDRTPGISLEKWLESPTSQGFPELLISDGDLHYLRPEERCVVRFIADFDKVVLDCSANPFSSDRNLGVRLVVEA